MKNRKFLPDRERAARNRIAFQGGSYSLVITAVVLAILIAVNVLVSALPTTLTKYDISSSSVLDGEMEPGRMHLLFGLMDHFS